jgi:predicted  nucleic acid-binding Zn-ribbon protein
MRELTNLDLLMLEARIQEQLEDLQIRFEFLQDRIKSLEHEDSHLWDAINGTCD